MTDVLPIRPPVAVIEAAGHGAGHGAGPGASPSAADTAPTATSSAAKTAALPGGAPLARATSRACASRTRTVGVRRIRSRLTSSRCDSASTSRWRTPATVAATSARMRRVIRQGAQNAVENCSSVARVPGVIPSSTRSLASSRRGSPPYGCALARESTAGMSDTGVSDIVDMPDTPVTGSPAAGVPAAGLPVAVAETGAEAEAEADMRVIRNRPSRTRMTIMITPTAASAPSSTHIPVTTASSASGRRFLPDPAAPTT